jgi:exopolysaccharide biosynthesis polyprenyl glycosylphosphotransferase
VSDPNVSFAAPTYPADTTSVLPRQRLGSPPDVLNDTVILEGARATVVLPRASSRVARRTRPLRAWMITLPVDFAALTAPLLWVEGYWRGVLFTAVFTVVIFASGGLYRGRRHMSILDELPSLVGRLLAAAAVVAVIASQRHDQVAYVGELMRIVAMSGGLVIVGRMITRRIVITARKRRVVEHGAIIVGCGPVAEEIARLLRRYPQYGLRFAGFIDDDGPSQFSKDLVPWIGRLDLIEEMVGSTESDVIIIADVNCSESRLMELARRPACMRCDLLVVPRLHNFHTQTGTPDHIGAIPVMRIRRPTLTGPKWALKRSLDLVLASVALVVLSPVLLLCAIGVLIEGGPGVFFRQLRVGRHGKPFKLIKFRSMKPVDERESQTNWSVEKDPRIGPFGRFLRRTSLDELPQLWNILRGDMTFVGPRPERPYFVERFAAEHPNYDSRHRVPAGLTGLAQVSGLRGDTPISDRTRFDNYYIENWSLWLDVKVLLRSIGEVFRGSGR